MREHLVEAGRLLWPIWAAASFVLGAFLVWRLSDFYTTRFGLDATGQVLVPLLLVLGGGCAVALIERRARVFAFSAGFGASLMAVSLVSI